jgi:hypothetical protein
MVSVQNWDVFFYNKFDIFVSKLEITLETRVVDPDPDSMLSES